MTKSKKFEKYINMALDLALTSNMTFRHSTLVLYRGNVIAVGVNSVARSYLRGIIVPSMHSEIQAVLNLSNRPKSRPMVIDLFVGRFTRDLKPRISRPCHLCIKMLNQMDNIEVRKVYYFNDNSQLVSEHFKRMESNYKTCGVKNLLDNNFCNSKLDFL
jgi:hypothetical protein